MGFFSSPIEKSLLKTYSESFELMGFSTSNAKTQSQELLESAQESLKQSGEDNLPPNFGDIFLEDPNNKNIIEQDKKEGVRENDIRWWLNLEPLERHMMIKMDELNKTTLLISLMEEGEEIDEALKAITEVHPVFGNPEDQSKQQGENRPLPESLKDRINIYIQRRTTDNPEKYKKDLEQSSSFNALVRKEIKNGNL